MSKKHSKAKQMALCGIMTALAVIILLVGGLIPIGTYAAPVFASLLLIPISIEMGAKIALLAYAAIALIAILLVPDQELVCFFIFLFGYYPILQPHISKLSHKSIRWICKILIMNIATIGVYCILLFLIASPPLLEEFQTSPKWMWGCLLLAANVMFILYDLLIDKVRLIYYYRFRKFFK